MKKYLKQIMNKVGSSEAKTNDNFSIFLIDVTLTLFVFDSLDDQRAPILIYITFKNNL